MPILEFPFRTVESEAEKVFTTYSIYLAHVRNCLLNPPDGLIDGGDFTGYGYPVEGGPEGRLPVGRLFKGYFMRYCGYRKPDADQVRVTGHDSYAWAALAGDLGC